MLRHTAEPSQACSEEKTEPFSQSEIDARLKRRSFPAVDWLDNPEASPIHLDLLRVEDHHYEDGVRLLVRPLIRTRSVSPGNENCQWVVFQTDDDSDDCESQASQTETPARTPEQHNHNALAVTQTAKDIKFTVRIPCAYPESAPHRPHLWCELYYDPGSDNQILYNRSDVPLLVSRESRSPSSEAGVNYVVNPLTTRALSPGSWKISIRDIPVLDFRILKKRAPAILSPKSICSDKFITSPRQVASPLNSSGKRPSTHEDDSPRNEKKARTDSTAAAAAEQEGVIMYLTLPSTSKELAKSNGQVLVEVEKGETVHVPGTSDLDDYQVTKRDQIASTALSTVYTAEHTHLPNQVVTVKVLKTRAASANVKPHEAERNVIRQADMWLREYQSQDDLQHDSIVKLFGGDARHLALFMEHVEARDLSAKGVWRSAAGDHFMGTRADAARILQDISKALHYIHSRNLVHNDIKPSNILYSPERGAALCDFGLSTHTKVPAAAGGTPYYVPPEFIGRKMRGAPSDVWAMGVTMLYVLRKIPFPDARAARAHPRRLYWLIADLNRPVAMGGRMQSSVSAVSQMQAWLSEISSARSKLDPRDLMERLVADMLVPNPHQRITVSEVLGELFTEEVGAVAVGA